MASSTKLVKNTLYKCLAEGVYRDVVTKSSSYYYFLGKTLSWEDENNPSYPVDSVAYERDARNEIITIKEIKPSDVAFVIPKREWVTDVVYDMYDDKYSDEVLGINIISGGSGFINVDDITIEITGGGGTGATAVAVEAFRGGISKVILTNPGTGYTSEPTVTVFSESGSDAILKATMGIAPSGAQKIEDANFYVITDDYNVYKCLDNNNNSKSTAKPVGTQLEPIELLDGYIWKFMYNVPINLRNKFYTDEHIPVVSALTNHFYSNGTIDNIFIANKGEGYTSAIVSVSGDGYRESDPIYINEATVVLPGTGYIAPTVDFSPPVTGASQFVSNNSINIGQVVYNTNHDYYECVTPGQMSSIAPSHKYGTVLNGESALKYVGTKLKGTLSTRNDKNIVEIALTNPGTGYTTPPTVTITDSTGVNAAATAVIGPSTIIDANIVAGGSGYISPTINIVGGGGVGAMISPIVTGGVITDVIVVDQGVGYTSTPQLVVTDAYGVGANLTAVLSGSPLTAITLTNGGSGYTNPQVTITGGGGAAAVGTPKVETGIITDITLNGAVRDVVVIDSGSGYIEPPEVIIGMPVDHINIVQGGTGYTSAPSILISGGGGVGATAVATVSGGSISTITVTNRGSGYTNSPTVYITGGGGSNAQATASLVSGSYAVVKSKLYADKVISTYTINPGENYLEVPSITFGKRYEQDLEVYTNQQYSYGNNLYTVMDNGIFGSTPPTHTFNDGTVFTSPAWVANTNVVFGQTVYVSTRMYKVITAGMTGGSAPTHTSGAVANGAAVLQYVGKPASLKRAGTTATGYATMRYGAGYSVTPDVFISDLSEGNGAEINFFTAKSEAKISAITEDGQISYIVVEDPGIGYTKATMIVTGEGEGASLIPDLSLGSISSQQANNEILTASGTIDAIAIVSGGYSYGVANISIEGDGTGATATAVINPLTNSIEKINIVNRGEGYTYANVKVIGNGQGAQLRAIISPFGGHGKNCPEELYSRSLMFYSNISTDLNQGVVVANDYRQVGIIRNPRVFDGFQKFQGAIGSACYIIQSPINTARFFKDDELFIERTNNPSIEWEPSLELTLGDFIFYEDRIYTVVVSGVGGSSPPVTTTGSETNGFAVLTYVGSTKTRKRYRIVSVTESSALVQSLDNDIPGSSDVFIKASSITDSFTPSQVNPPLWEPNTRVADQSLVYSDTRLYKCLSTGFTGASKPIHTSGTVLNGEVLLEYFGKPVFTATSTSVGLPSFDKYSGQLLYIDNKQGFTPSESETITLRTIIKF